MDLPGGYITHLVWDKVPGQSLSSELFWSFDEPQRDLIRQSFEPLMTKLIWDQDSGQLHISGFSMAAKVDPTKEWSDNVFAMYNLIKRPRIGGEDIAGWER
ncbi:unnamed protein product [Penicillium viridicatum]